MRVPLYLKCMTFSQHLFFLVMFLIAVFLWHLRVHKKVQLSWCFGACVPKSVRVRCEVTGIAGGSMPLKILTLLPLSLHFRSTLLFASLSLSPHLLHWSHCLHSVLSGVYTSHTLDSLFDMQLCDVYNHALFNSGRSRDTVALTAW